MTVAEQLQPWDDAHLLDERVFGRAWCNGPYSISLPAMQRRNPERWREVSRRRWRNCAAKTYASAWTRPLLMRAAADTAYRRHALTQKRLPRYAA